MHAAGEFLALRRRHNLGTEPQVVELDAAGSGHIALSTQLDREGDEASGRVSLHPNGSVAVRLG